MSNELFVPLPDILSSMSKFCPFFQILFDESGTPFDCGDTALYFLGCKQKSDFLKNPSFRVAGLYSYTQPDGSTAVNLPALIAEAIRLGAIEFECILKIHGKYIPYYIVMQRLPAPHDNVVSAFHVNLSLPHKTTEHLLAEQKLLTAVCETGEILITPGFENFDDGMRSALRCVGKAVSGSNIYLWKNIEQDGRQFCVCIANAGLSKDSSDMPVRGYSATLEYSETLPGLWELLHKGNCFVSLIRKLPSSQRDFFVKQGILSVCAAPIFINNSFWGFLVIDDCSKERLYNELDETALKKAGFLAACAYICRQDNEKLDSARIAAIDNARGKNIFLSHLSRQIRTPLNAIVAMSSIASDAGEEDGEKTKNCLLKIKDASSQLLRIMEDITDMSQIDRSRFVFDSAPFSFRTMLNGVIESYTESMPSNHQDIAAQIDSNVPDNLIGDKLRIAQVIENLLSDLSKYSPHASQITLMVTEVSRDATESILDFTLAVSGSNQTGAGIADIIKAFPSGDSSVPYEDIGLGLSLAKRIVEQMGGEILFSAASEKGAQYSFSLRFIRDNKLSEALRLGRGREPGKVDFSDKRILAAEDIEINQIIIRSLLEKTGVSIDIAETGAAALSMFSKDPLRYDLILMDISMPVMDGLEATRRIRALEAKIGGAVPIIAVTANAFTEELLECKEIGMNDYITKPLDPSALIHIIGRHLAKT